MFGFFITNSVIHVADVPYAPTYEPFSALLWSLFFLLVAILVVIVCMQPQPFGDRQWSIFGNAFDMPQTQTQPPTPPPEEGESHRTAFIRLTPHEADCDVEDFDVEDFDVEVFSFDSLDEATNYAVKSFKSNTRSDQLDKSILPDFVSQAIPKAVAAKMLYMALCEQAKLMYPLNEPGPWRVSYVFPKVSIITQPKYWGMNEEDIMVTFDGPIDWGVSYSGGAYVCSYDFAGYNPNEWYLETWSGQDVIFRSRP